MYSVLLRSLNGKSVQAETPNISDSSYIYWACKGNNPHYCQQLFRSMATSFVWATASYPANDRKECGKEKQEATDRLQWFSTVISKYSWEEASESFVSAVDLESKGIALKYKDALMSTLFDMYNSEDSKISTPNMQMSGWESSQNSRDLYISCKKMITLNQKPHVADICHSLITGVQFGLDLAAYNLPNHPAETKCGQEKNEITQQLRTRLFNADYKCHFITNQSTGEIAEAYVQRLNQANPDTIMSIAHEAPEQEMLRTIKQVCKKGQK